MVTYYAKVVEQLSGDAGKMQVVVQTAGGENGDPEYGSG